MSDDENSEAQPPDHQEILSAVQLSYKAVLNDLVSAGDRLSNVADLVDQLDDGELVSMPFLLSRQLEVIRLAVKWVSHTVKHLPEGDADDEPN